MAPPHIALILVITLIWGHLKINVVDIQGTGAGNCLAASTGGKVFTANNVNELSINMGQAAQDVLGPGNCK